MKLVVSVFLKAHVGEIIEIRLTAGVAVFLPQDV